MGERQSSRWKEEPGEFSCTRWWCALALQAPVCVCVRVCLRPSPITILIIIITIIIIHFVRMKTLASPVEKVTQRKAFPRAPALPLLLSGKFTLKCVAKHTDSS